MLPKPLRHQITVTGEGDRDLLEVFGGEALERLNLLIPDRLAFLAIELRLDSLPPGGDMRLGLTPFDAMEEQDQVIAREAGGVADAERVQRKVEARKKKIARARTVAFSLLAQFAGTRLLRRFARIDVAGRQRQLAARGVDVAPLQKHLPKDGTEDDHDRERIPPLAMRTGGTDLRPGRAFDEARGTLRTEDGMSGHGTLAFRLGGGSNANLALALEENAGVTKKCHFS